MRSEEITHRIMASIKQADTEPELMLRKALWKRGLRFRKNFKQLPGKPDVVFTRAKIAVFCDGDFWHGHNWALRGLSSLDEELLGYSDFWREKILHNIERDKTVTEMLKNDGWCVIRFYESDIRCNLDSCIEVIALEYSKRLSVK